MKLNSTKIITGLVTLMIVFLLVVSGPVNAFNLSLSADKEKAERGEKIKFTASIEINSNEYLDIDYLTIVLNGATSKTCKFDVNGNKLSNCEGITQIRLISNTATYGYGYGYGYGYTSGKLEYEIILDTDNFKKGKYQTELQIEINGKTFSEDGPEFTIENGRGGGEEEREKEIEISEQKLGLVDIKEGEDYNFVHIVNYKSDSHVLKAEKIKGIGVELTIFSQSENLIINLGETKQIDLDLDGTKDIELKVIYVGDKQATLSYNSLTGKIEFKEKIKETNLGGVEYTALKKQKISNILYFQLANFRIMWILVLINLIIIELIGIVNIQKP